MIVADVLDGGLFTTVQDLGRVGYLRYGVPASGALDRAVEVLRRGGIGRDGGGKGASYEITALAAWALLHGYAFLVIDNARDGSVGSAAQIGLVLERLADMAGAAYRR